MAKFQQFSAVNRLNTCRYSIRAFVRKQVLPFTSNWHYNPTIISNECIASLWGKGYLTINLPASLWARFCLSKKGEFLLPLLFIARNLQNGPQRNCIEKMRLTAKFCIARSLIKLALFFTLQYISHR